MSGSTSMSVRDHDGVGCTTFLDTSKLLLDGILECPTESHRLFLKEQENQSTTNQGTSLALLLQEEEGS